MKPTKCSAFLMFPGTASVHRDMRHQNKWDAIDSMYELPPLHEHPPPLCTSSTQSEDINFLPMYKSQLTQCIQYMYYRPMDHQCWIYLDFNAGLSIEGGRQQKYIDRRDEHRHLLWRHTSNFSLSFRKCMYSKHDPVGLSISSTESAYFALIFSWKRFSTLEKARKGKVRNKVTEMWHECDTNNISALATFPLPHHAPPHPTPPHHAPPRHVYVQPKRCKTL